MISSSFGEILPSQPGSDIRVHLVDGPALGVLFVLREPDLESHVIGQVVCVLDVLVSMWSSGGETQQ